jgi:hypothetical protein
VAGSGGEEIRAWVRSGRKRRLYQEARLGSLLAPAVLLAGVRRRVGRVLDGVVLLSGTVPTGRSLLTTDRWTAGPALGFVNSSSKQYNWGLFAQTFFSFAGKDGAPDIGLVNLQPIFSYQLGDGRSLSWRARRLKKSRWASLNLGLNYGQVVSFAGHKWRPNIEADYDLKTDYGNPKWTFRASIVLLLPTH